jgi:hypothetical protein
MGGELMGLKDALHRSQTYARRLRQHPAGPMAGFSRRRRERALVERVAQGSSFSPIATGQRTSWKVRDLCHRRHTSRRKMHHE